MRVTNRLMCLSLSVAALTAGGPLAHAQGGVQNAYYYPPRQDRSVAQAIADDAAETAAQPKATQVSAPVLQEPPATQQNPYYYPPQSGSGPATPPPNTAAATTVNPALIQTQRYYPPMAAQQTASTQTMNVPGTTYESTIDAGRPYQPAPTVRPVPPTELPPAPPSMMLDTRQGIDVGIQGSYYRYRESSADVTLLGGMLGFTGAGTMVFPDHWYGMIDGRYAFAPGGVNYHGSGTSSGNANDLWEVRLTGGKDLHFQYFVMSPYIGLGYRDLYEDGRGTTSIGAEGYRRLNQMLYLPVGFSPRWRVDDETRVAMKIEYDATLLGIQHSDLSDVSPAISNVINRQTDGGSGVRAEIMYETQSWSAGPFFNYWDIGQSEGKVLSGAACTGFGVPSPCTLVEPRNHTTEAGVQVKYHFF